MKMTTPLALAALLALSTATPLLAQDMMPDAEIAQLRDAALDDDYAWNITEGLTTEVGQRLAGTEAEARARIWGVAKLKALGFDKVWVEEFDMPVWSRGVEGAEIISPFPQKLAVAALGNSASTGPAGITGEVIGFGSVAELNAASEDQVRGKIVFITHDMRPTQDGSSYGQFGAPRRQGPSAASKKGAIGIVVRSIGTDSHRNPHTGVMSFEDGVTPIPAGALSNPDADQMERMLATGRKITMHLTLVSQVEPNGKSGNVIAELTGRDPTLPPIVIGGHLDSWDLGTGALDDATGVAITTAAAKRIMDAGRPLRTIRVVWFGAEEVGLFGGTDYRKRHTAEPHYAVAESDFGADRIWRVTSKLGEERIEEARALGRLLAPLGILTGSFNDANASDLSLMINDGHPGVGLNQDGTRYFDFHHTPDDTLDKVDLDQLRQNVAAWTAMLAVLSGGIE